MPGDADVQEGEGDDRLVREFVAETEAFLPEHQPTPPITYNHPNFQANQSLGLMLMHHFNRAGQRVDVVSLGQPGQTQTVSFAPGSPTAKTLGAPPFTVSVTASSGLAVTIASQTPAVCTIDGADLVTLVSAGTCTLTRANPAAPMTVPVIVTDGRGPWETFVGLGAWAEAETFRHLARVELHWWGPSGPDGCARCRTGQSGNGASSTGTGRMRSVSLTSRTGPST